MCTSKIGCSLVDEAESHHLYQTTGTDGFLLCAKWLVKLTTGRCPCPHIKASNKTESENTKTISNLQPEKPVLNRSFKLTGIHFYNEQNEPD